MLSGNAPALAVDALLYVAQGLPLGLINSALPAWLLVPRKTPE